MNEKICNRCGACCHFKDETGKVRRCKNLVKVGKGRFSCRIYSQKGRIGSEIYHSNDGKFKIYCNNVEDVGLNWNGCPFNKPENEEAPPELQPPF